MLHVPRSCCTSALRGQLLLGDYRQWRRRLEVPAATFAVAHPSGCRRSLPFTGSWVTTCLRRNLRPPLIVTWILGVTLILSLHLVLYLPLNVTWILGVTPY